MDFTRQELEDAALLLVVDENGHYKWSSTRGTDEVVKQLRSIASNIADNYATTWARWGGVDTHTDICAIHLAPRAIQEDPSVCWEYEGTSDCHFTTRHQVRTSYRNFHPVEDCPVCGDDAHLTFPSARPGAPDFGEYECSSCGKQFKRNSVAIGSSRVIGPGVHYGGAVSVVRGRYRIQPIAGGEQ